MAERVSWETLRRLASFRAKRGCAISMYLNLDPSEAATAGEVATRINSLLDQGARSQAAGRAALGHEQRVAVKTDFDRIRRFFETGFDRDGMQGFALFAAGRGAPPAPGEPPQPPPPPRCGRPGVSVAPPPPPAPPTPGPRAARARPGHG